MTNFDLNNSGSSLDVEDDQGTKIAKFRDDETVEASALSTERVLNVSDGDELIDAVNNAQDGNWIKLGTGGFVIDSWLDLDGVSGVKVIGEGGGGGGDPVTRIKVADGANVGGFRIGKSSPTENITIKNIGYNGNAVELDSNGDPVTDGSGNYTYNQDQSVKHLHGVIVGANASNVTVQNNFITNCSPFRDHDDGGTPVTIRSGAEWVAVDNNRMRWGGDRNVQSAGKYVVITRNKINKKYDRGISLDVFQKSDKQWHYTEKAVVANNHIDDDDGEVDGSCIAVGGRNSSSRTDDGIAAGEVLRDISIVGNVLRGGRKGVHVSNVDGSLDGNVTIGRNAIHEPDDRGIWVSGTSDPNITVSGNTINGGATTGGIDCGAASATVSNNSVKNVNGYGIKMANTGSVTGNTIKFASGDGIIASTPNTTVTANRIWDATGVGIRTTNNRMHVGDNVVMSVDSHGMSIEGAESSVTANSVVSPGDQAIVLTGSCSDTLVEGNYAQGGPISESSVDNNIILSNVVRGGGQVYHTGTSTVAMWNYPQRTVDLSGRTPPDGTIMQDDGTNGPVGALYERNGGSWHGIGAASGTTI